MVRRADDFSNGSIVVVSNPDEDTSPEALRSWLDELLSGPEPQIESVNAAEVLRELRTDSDV